MKLIDEIKKLRALEQQATPAKWETEENDGGHEIRMGKAIESPGQYPCHLVIEYEHGCFEDDENDPPANTQAAEAEANAYLISNLRNLAPAMLAVLEMIREGDAERSKNIPCFRLDGDCDRCSSQLMTICLMVDRWKKAASLMENRMQEE